MLPIAFRNRKAVPTWLLALFFLACSNPAISRACPPYSTIKNDTIIHDSWEEWTPLVAEVIKVQTNLQEQWDRRKRPSSPEDIAALNDLYFRLEQIDKVYANLQNLAASPHNYGLQNIDLNGAGYTSYDPARDAIIFCIGRRNPFLFVHETTHGKQFEEGKLVFNKKSGAMAGDDVDDELDAYRAEYAFDTASLHLRSHEEITASWLWQLRNAGKNYLYNWKNDTIDRIAAIGIIPVSLDSDSSILQRAFPLVTQPWRLQFPMRDSTNFIYCLPQNPPLPPSTPSSRRQSR